MDRVTSRDFRGKFHLLKEPVEVLSGITTVGYYFPVGTKPGAVDIDLMGWMKDPAFRVGYEAERALLDQEKKAPKPRTHDILTKIARQ